MGILSSFLSPRLRLLAQQREIARLREEIIRLRTQVESMQGGMRRCVSCDYRTAFRATQGSSSNRIPYTGGMRGVGATAEAGMASAHAETGHAANSRSQNQKRRS